MNLYEDKLVGIEGVRDLRSDEFCFGSTLVLEVKRDKDYQGLHARCIGRNVVEES